MTKSISFPIRIILILFLPMSFTDVRAQQESAPAKLGKPPVDSKNSATERDLNLESFEFVWKTIRDSHWDESLVGDSWTQSREKLLPRIKSASSIDEAREIMTELINTLGQSHFGIIPEDSYEVMSGEGGGTSDVGITGRLCDGKLLVTRVRPDSSAVENGVQTGWSIEELRNRTAEKLIQRFEDAADGPQRAETIAGLALDKMFSGRKGSTVDVKFRDQDGSLVEKTLKCEPAPGKFAKLGNLPPIRVDDETRTIEGDIGYYRFNAFLDPVRIMPAYRKAVRDSKHSRGMIIDLRGNLGGLAAMTMGMASEFVVDRQYLGTMNMKGTELKFVVNPLAKPTTAPVAVLVDECSISSAEIFAGGLKDLQLARIFGKRTAGLALPSMVVKLPNGDGFQYAMADYHSASGETLELKGVVPDETIELNQSNLSDSQDPVLEAAIEWIKSKSG